MTCHTGTGQQVWAVREVTAVTSTLPVFQGPPDVDGDPEGVTRPGATRSARSWRPPGPLGWESDATGAGRARRVPRATAKTVQRAFLTESLFVTLEGVVLGTALSIVTTYLLFENYELFQSAGGGFSIPWLSITILVVAATGASVLATVWPARQASPIRPAVALRISE